MESERMNEQRLNAYYCDTCRRYVVTVDRDEGATPMFLACRADGDPTDEGFTGCTGLSQSMGYPALNVWPIDPTPTWEWYKPGAAEHVTFGESMREHLNAGGLALRQIAQVVA